MPPPCNMASFRQQHQVHQGFNGIGQDNLQSRLDLVFQVDDVDFVFFGEDHHLDPGPLGRQDLLPDAAHRQDAAGKGQLAGQGHVPAGGPAGEQGEQGQGDGDPGGGPFFGDGPGGQVDVDVTLGEEVRVQAEGLGVAADIGEGGLG